MLSSNTRPRSTRTLLLAALVGASLLTACSSTSESVEPADAAPSSASTDGLAEPGAFPATVAHAYGETVIDAEPERIVTIGWSGQDAVLALGKVPVAAERFTGSGIVDDILPWNTELFAGTTPELLTSNPDVPFEQIMALEPDVILAVYSGISETDYTRLSEIAPTVAFPDNAWETSWQDQTTIIGAALGQPARADELVEGISEQLAATKAANPGLEGKTITYAMSGDADVIVFCPSDPRIEMLVAIGLEPSAGTLAACGDGSESSVTVAAELVSSLDADAFILIDVEDTTLDRLLQNQLFAALPSVADGRIVQVLGMDYAMATSAPTVLSIPYALEEFVSQLTSTLS